MGAKGSFDALAETYDRFRIGYAPELYKALAEYGLAAGARVLDVGSGTGIVSRALADLGDAVTGIDISEPMIERARERVPEATFVLGSADALPFEAKSFDAATSAQTFHWFDQPKALAEISRVVVPGGIVAVWWKALMRGDTTRLLRETVGNELGVAPLPDLLAQPFDAFAQSGLTDRRLIVIPWRVPTTVDDFIGYERSRARAREAFGNDVERYFTRLRERLETGGSDLTLAYVHHLYLGRVPE